MYKVKKTQTISICPNGEALELPCIRIKEGKSAPYGHNTLSDFYLRYIRLNKMSSVQFSRFHRIKQKPLAYWILQMVMLPDSSVEFVTMS